MDRNDVAGKQNQWILKGGFLPEVNSSYAHQQIHQDGTGRGFSNQHVYQRPLELEKLNAERGKPPEERSFKRRLPEGMKQHHQLHSRPYQEKPRVPPKQPTAKPISISLIDNDYMEEVSISEGDDIRVPLPPQSPSQVGDSSIMMQEELTTRASSVKYKSMMRHNRSRDTFDEQINLDNFRQKRQIVGNSNPRAVPREILISDDEKEAPCNPTDKLEGPKPPVQTNGALLKQHQEQRVEKEQPARVDLDKRYDEFGDERMKKVMDAYKEMKGKSNKLNSLLYSKDGTEKVSYSSKYRTIEKLEACEIGGCELVRAVDKSNEQVCLVKTSKEGAPKSENYLRREHKILQQVNNEHVPKISALFESTIGLHLVFKDVAGMRLEKLLKEESKLVEADAKIVLQGVGAALKACHEIGIAHRDVRLNNVVVNHETFQATLVNFGYAAIVVSGKKVESRCGSLAFMSPEMLGSKEPYCPKKADIWALGIVAYYTLTGTHPFYGNRRSLTQRLELQRTVKLERAARSNNKPRIRARASQRLFPQHQQLHRSNSRKVRREEISHQRSNLLANAKLLLDSWIKL